MQGNQIFGPFFAMILLTLTVLGCARRWISCRSAACSATAVRGNYVPSGCKRRSYNALSPVSPVRMRHTW